METKYSIFKTYWNYYGGFKELIKSGYFYLSFFINLLCFNTWTVAGWWNDVLTIIPGMLGFTLGGLSVLMAFSNSNFQSILVKVTSKRGITLWQGMPATFTHYIIVQVTALLLALVLKSLDSIEIHNQLIISFIIDDNGKIVCWLTYLNYFFWFIGYLTFIYGIILCVGAILSVFQYSIWYSEFLIVESKSNSEEDVSENDTPIDIRKISEHPENSDNQ